MSPRDVLCQKLRNCVYICSSYSEKTIGFFFFWTRCILYNHVTLIESLYAQNCLMQRKSSKVSERSFAIGTIAETLQTMGDAASGFVVPLYPVVMATVKDEDEEVRSNAIYGLGVLVANGGQVALPYPC